ncbi:MAG TPA: class I tRNA ligase family protein, partial [Candidatus Deferrimicrobium sp.]|nr:class I tRNA ligase family protein [Candidatus Deferrimicrobium sp.]
LDTLVHLMAPILSFTAEEIWGYMPDKHRRSNSIFLSPIPEPDVSLNDPQVTEKWDRIFQERSEVLKALEQARAAGIIGHSLDASVVFEPLNGAHGSLLRDLIENDRNRLQDLLIVSQASLSGDPAAAATNQVSSYDADSLNCRITVGKASGRKCERCWKYDADVGKDQSHPTVCARCAAVLNAGATA